MSKAAELANLIGNINAGGGGVNRNLIINGAMNVAQRGTSFTTVANGAYTIDQFRYGQSNDGEITITQDSSAPDGFAKSLKVDVTTADTSIAAGQYADIFARIEAQNLQRLAFGTSSAKNFTLSFYVKSNKTGTYAVTIGQSDNSFKQAVLNYTINSADTWERKSLTFTGDTAGVIDDNADRGFEILWWLAVGSTYTGGSATGAFATYADANHAAGHAVNLLDSTSNEWLLTGVQLEVGQNPTEFEHQKFPQTLKQCQRYFHNVTAAGHPFPVDSAYSRYITFGQDTNALRWFHHYPVQMRATPSFTANNITTSTVQFFNYDSATNISGNLTGTSLSESGALHAQMAFTFSSGVAAGNITSLRWNNNPDASFDFNAEL